ncbi:MAG TPA: FGGY family carbohydrate kinase, partial [Chloroflexota bacterium]|nr:FGGY family carbohydrate kinase [Chloroflexota bacterium]
MEDLLLGIDLGTTGTRTGLFSATGEALAEASAPTPLRRPGLGAVDQDPDDFYLAATRTVAECLARAGVANHRIAAIGITGQMAGVLGIDHSWRPSIPYDSWLDTRCSPDVTFLERELGDDLVERTGCPAMVNHAPKLRWWQRQDPGAFSRTAKFVMPNAYVAGKLAGLTAEGAFIDHTYLHFTGLADARRGAWSPPLMAALGVPEPKLPRIVEPATVIGRLTREAAGQCGLLPGVPIAAGLGDTAAGALGAGITRPRQLLDTAGTAAVLAASTDQFRPDPRERTLIVMRGALPEQWISLSYLSGGSLLSWFQTAITASDGLPTEVDFDRLEEAFAGIAAGSDGVLFIPYLDGRVLPSDPDRRGAWAGLDRHHTWKHLGHAILESVAYEYAGYLRILRALHPDLAPTQTRVVGGGAHSKLWNRMKATVLGVEYAALDRDEVSCWGAALVA